MLNSILSGIVALPFHFMDTLHQRKINYSHPGSLCDLSLPVGNSEYFITDTRNITTVFEISGGLQYITNESYNFIISMMHSYLAPILANKTADFAFYHIQDDEPGANEAMLRNALSGVINSSKMQGLKNSAFIEERIDNLRSRVQSEKTYLVVWTRRDANRGVGEKVVNFKTNTDGSTPDLQALNSHNHNKNTHIQTIEALSIGFKEAGIFARKLKNSEVCKNLALCVDPDGNANFVPRLFGEISGDAPNGIDTYAKRFTLKAPKSKTRGSRGKDYSVVLPPKIGFQVWNKRPEYVGSTGVKIGKRIYGSSAVTLTPDSPVAFDVLVSYASAQNLPFRVSMHMKTANQAMVQTKHGLAAALSAFKSPNMELLRDNFDSFLTFLKRRGTSLSLQVVFTTWSESGDKKQLDERMSALSALINRWGNSQSQVLQDDALYGVLSTIPTYRSNSIADFAVGPSEEILYLAPLTRPASPWDKGAILFTDRSGKCIPWQPMTSLQSHHVYLISGAPGFGKSLFFQMLLIALSESGDILPYVVGVDVGPSQKGTVDYLRAILPADKKHLVGYYHIQNTPEFAVNPGDTLLGSRYLVSTQKLFLVEFYLNALSESGGVNEDLTYPKGTDGILSEAIDLAYKQAADTGPHANPRRYKPSITTDKYWDGDILPALKRINLIPEESMSYWSIVDALFDKGEYRAAALIQRYAMPLARDIGILCNSQELSSLAARPIEGTYTLGAYLYDRFSSIVKEFVILKTPTQLDLGESRIISFNLADVVPTSESQASGRIGTVFYAATSRAAVNKFFYNEDMVKELPERIREYHKHQMELVKRTKNMYACDELQRFTSCPAATRIPVVIAKEGRKSDAGVVLSTQRPQEFSQELIEQSTARFFMGFNRSAINTVAEHFEMTENEKGILSRIHMPTREGSKMLAQIETKHGTISQELILKVGIRMLWGLSTKNISNYVRSKVTTEFGYEAGIKILAKLYPDGEVESECERRRTAMGYENLTLSGLQSFKDNQEYRDIVNEISLECISKGRDFFRDIIEEQSHEYRSN